MHCSKCGQEFAGNGDLCDSCGLKQNRSEIDLTDVEKDTVAVESDFVQVLDTHIGEASAGVAPVSGRTPKNEVMSFKTKLLIGLIMAALLISLGVWRNMGPEANVQDKLDLAIKYLSENDYEKAILTYQEAIKIDARSAAAYKGLSLAYQLQGKSEEAEKALNDGLKAAGDVSELQLALAGFYVDTGKTELAEAIYKKQITGKNSVQAYNGYTKMLAAQGKGPDAIALLERAIQANPDYRLENMLAELQMKYGDRDNTVEILKKSLTVQSEQAQAYSILNGFYTGRAGEMLSLGDQFIQQGNLLVGKLVRMQALYEMGKYDELLSEYQQSGQEIMSNQRARILAAKAYSKSGKNNDAQLLLKLVDQAKLLDSGLAADLAAFYLETGDKENARRLAMKGIEIEPYLADNYLVMYKSYIGESNSQAQMWKIKYLLQSCEGLKAAQSIFGIKQAPDSKEVGKDAQAAEIVSLLTTLKERSAQYPAANQFYSLLYLDTSGNIAYEGRVERANGWKTVIVRYHNPQVKNKGEFSGKEAEEQQKNNPFFNTYDRFVWTGKNYTAVEYEGTRSFEQLLVDVGYNGAELSYEDR
ncbi:MAG: tetratricopeptide repeat protein [Syntrophomonadaceae bacterium]